MKAAGHLTELSRHSLYLLTSAFLENSKLMSLIICPQSSIKMCDPEYGKVGVQATGLVLTCLLKSGMTSPVAEVRSIRSVDSISTVVIMLPCCVLDPQIRCYWKSWVIQKT